MISVERLPQYYQRANRPEIVNRHNHSINAITEQDLRNGCLYSVYEGTGFKCVIWYNPWRKKWCGEVMQKGVYKNTYEATLVQELAFEVDRIYGQ